MQPIYSFLSVMFCVLIQCDGKCDQGAYEYDGVNDGEKNYIVNEHNRLRLLIAHGQLSGQPKGVNLKRFTWDDRLAQAAQNIANTCIYGHVRVEDCKYERYHNLEIPARWQVGQNIAASYSTNYVKGANWAEPITNWWKEYQNYRFGDGFGLTTGHYTQMAWDDTQFVGCGYTYYPQDGQFKYHKLYVCNYGPTGNYERAPYKTGSSGCANLC